MADSSGDDINIETFVVGDNLPTSVIPQEKPWYVQVTWQLTRTYLGLIKGSWVVDIFFESIGSIDSSSEFPPRRFTGPLIPEPDPVNYGPVNWEFTAHSLREGVYRVTASLNIIDPNGNPLPVVAFAEKIIAITAESDASVAADQAISTGIRVAATEQAISTGVHVATEANNIAATSKGVEVKSSEGPSIVIPYNKAFDKIVDSTKYVRNQLEQIYTQITAQAQRWFQVSLSAAIVGIILIVIGVVMLLTGYTSTGIVSMISSIIPETIATLCFVQSRKANQRVDGVTDQLNKISEMNYLKEIIDTMEDPKSRDKLKAEFIRKNLARGKKGA